MQLSLFNCILYSNQASIFILKRSSSQCRWKCEFSILSEYRQKLALIQIAVFQWKVNRLPGAPIGLWFKSLPQKIVHVSRKGARSTCKMVKIGNWGVPRTCSTREITAFSWLLANFGELDHTLHGYFRNCELEISCSSLSDSRKYQKYWMKQNTSKVTRGQTRVP